MNKTHEREYALKSAILDLNRQLQEHIETYGEHYKICTKCQEIQPLSEYYSRANGNLKPECRSCLKLRAREYDHTDAGRKARDIGKKRLREKPDFAQKQSAWARIQDLVRSGRILPAKEHKCEKCGSQADHYHHHNGYSREHREDVIPLCLQCHADEHFV